MKASLLLAGLAVAILSIAPANAEKKLKLAEAGVGCSVSGTWPNPTPVVCWPQGVKRFHSFNECRESLLKLGHDSFGISWFCSSQGYKT